MTADGRRNEAFESGNPRDAYSSVSHLKGNLDSLSFAIGLREEGGQEGALERLLPMLKIQPRPPGEVPLTVKERGEGVESRDKSPRGEMFQECSGGDCTERRRFLFRVDTCHPSAVFSGSYGTRMI